MDILKKPSKARMKEDIQKALLQNGVLTHSKRERKEPRSILKTALYSMSTFSFFSLLALFVEF